MTHSAAKQMFIDAPPEWSLSRNKPLLQHIWDFIGAPLRMAIFPDHINERLHMTSLRAERLSNVLPALEGRVLDIGAGDNMLLNLYRKKAEKPEIANQSVGVDVVDWGGDCVIVPDCKHLPFENASFDTVSFVACLNHIPERQEALQEAFRVLKPGGRVVITMIGRFIGTIGHAIWWYSEDKHREVHKDEMMGMDPKDIYPLLQQAGFSSIQERGFVYGLNRLITAEKNA